MSRAFKRVRNKDLSVWPIEKLKEHINACQKMEENVEFNKARRSWKHAKQEAEAELERRLSEMNS